MPAASKPSLVTLGDFFRFAVRRFKAARLAYGHGTTNAVDEAAFMLLEALRLPIHILDPWLDLKPTPAERTRLLTLIDARVALRMPAPYLLGAAYMRGVRFHVDRRALIPRSFIGDILADGALPSDPGKVKRVLDLCTGSSCLAILAALAFPRARVDAVDLSAAALAVARRNVASHRLGDRITLHRGWRWPPGRTASIWCAASSPRLRGTCAGAAGSSARSAAAGRRWSAPIRPPPSSGSTPSRARARSSGYLPRNPEVA